LGKGNGQFAAAKTYSMPAGTTFAAAADVNRDGIADIVAVSGGTVNVLLGTGKGNFSAGPTFILGDTAYQLLVRDLDGDGIPDIAAPLSRQRCGPDL
jgi:hypothetical protein